MVLHVKTHVLTMTHGFETPDQVEFTFNGMFMGYSASSWESNHETWL